MSWDRLEAAAWLASTPTADGEDSNRDDSRGDGGSSNSSSGGGGGGGRDKTVLMQGGTGDAEVTKLCLVLCGGVFSEGIVRRGVDWIGVVARVPMRIYIYIF